MKNLIDISLIIGFLVVDFLFFHDLLKVGEVITAANYLTGILSVVVIIRSVGSLLKGNSA